MHERSNMIDIRLRRRRVRLENSRKNKRLLSRRENQNILNEFLLSLKEENKSKYTIKRYQYVLRNFMKVMDKPFSLIQTDDIQKWIHGQEKNWSKKAKYVHLSNIRIFYRFCMDRGYTDKSPVHFRGKVGERTEVYWEVSITLPNKETERVINEFLLSLKNTNEGENNIISYRRKLQCFFKEQGTSYTFITPNDIKLWISKYEKVRKRKTIQSYINSLLIFYDYCLEKGYIKESPIQYLDKRKEGKYWEVHVFLPNQENLRVINDYLLHLKAMNYSKATIKFYRFSLQTFFKNRKELFSDLASETILIWLNQYKKGRKETTFSNQLSALTSFYAFCIEEGYIEKSPIKARWYPRLPKPIPKYLEKDEVAKVWQESEKEGLRNRALMEFLLSSGCRIGEVHHVNRTDIDLEERTALVKGKGNKIRQIHFTEKCALLLERYLESRNDQNPALFVKMKGKPTRLSIVRMQSILREIGERAGLTGSFHPHRLRHTFATQLLEKGADLAYIADELGHSELVSTQIYANVTKRKIISMYRKYMG